MSDNSLSNSKLQNKNEVVRIERKVVHTEPIKNQKIALVGNKVKVRGHCEEKQNKDFWLTRPVEKRLEAVTLLRAQVVKNSRMDKTFGLKWRLK